MPALNHKSKAESMKDDLAEACRLGDVDKAAACLDAGAPLVPVHWKDQHPLDIAVQNDKGDVVRLLVARGAEFDRRSANGITALRMAVGRSNRDAAQALIEAGADVNLPAGQQQLTPLHMAAQENDSDMVWMLMRASAQPNAQDVKGQTPLHLAVTVSAHLSIPTLIAGGADVEALDGSGRTPLQLAAEQHRGSVLILIAFGADSRKLTHTDPPEFHGLPPMHAAAMLGMTQWVIPMLESDPDIKRLHNGKTAMDAARDAGHHELVALLQSMQARRAIDRLLDVQSLIQKNSHACGTSRPGG